MHDLLFHQYHGVSRLVEMEELMMHFEQQMPMTAPEQHTPSAW
jgi:hypothetical protein